MIELKLFISLLRLTEKGPVSTEDVKRDVRIPGNIMEKMLHNLQNEELVSLKGPMIETDTNARLKLAVKAVQLGADVENISSLLHWREFEEMSALALQKNGYVAFNDVHFKHESRKWQIDVVGCRKPLVVCIDCKHYHFGVSQSTIHKIASTQMLRTKALRDALPNIKMKLECTNWQRAKFVPAVLSLLPSAAKFYDNVPVVPVLQLQDFLCQLPMQIEALTYFQRDYVHLGHDF